MADKLKQGKFDSFTVINNGLIETDLLTEHEKMVYIVIRKYLNQEKQTAFPGMTTIAREARICKSVVIKAIQGLEEKGLLIVKRQTTKYNEKKTNVYHFNDFAELWKARTVNELKKIATEMPLSLTDDEIIDKALQIDKKKRQKLYTQLAKEFEKEKELVSEPTKAHTQALDNQNISNKQNTTNKTKSQVERYTIEDIKILYEYDNLITQYPTKQIDIDVIFNILYDTLNNTKQTIRISGENKPNMVVISKLMKLQPNDLIYSIDKYHQQTIRIKNVKNYLLTILYNCQDQQHLDIMNLGHHNGDF